MFRHIVLLLSVLFAAACPLQTVFASPLGGDEEEYDPVLPPDPSSGYILSLQASPSEGVAALSGDGAYQSGAKVAISATPADGYIFVQWTCNETVVSTAAQTTSTMPAAHTTLTAQFALKPRYTLSLTTSPAEGATLLGAGSYYGGERVRVAARLQEDYTFLRWEQNGTTVSTDTAFFFTMPDADVALQALCRYAPMRAVSVKPDYASSGSVKCTPAATTSENGIPHYAVGTSLQISATAKTGFEFAHWTLNGTVFTTESAFNYTVGMQDVAFIAVFDYNPEQPADPAENIKNKVLLACDPVGAATFNYATQTEHTPGTVLSLQATTKSGYRPDGWYIGESKMPNQTVNGQKVTVAYTVTDASSVTLTYRATEIIKSQLNLQSSPAGVITFNTASGTVYEVGTVLNLRAVVADGYLFDGWYEGDSLLAMTTSLTYTIGEQATTLTAKATKVQTEEGGEDGEDEEEWDPLPPIEPALETVYIIAQSEDNNKGRAYGSASYVVGKTATIRAVPNIGYEFSRWSDGNTDTVRTLTVSVAKTYTAYFSPKQYQVTVLSSNTEHGTVSGGGSYAYHSSATIKATPAAGCTFLRWSDDSTEPIHNIYISSDTTLTAFFAPPTCRIALSATPIGAGTATGAGEYEKGSVVRITATPAQDYAFACWSDGNTDNPRSVTLTSDTAFAAQFIHEAALSAITCDGVPVENFDPAVLEYSVTLPATQTQLPVIAATAVDVQARLVFIQATTVPGQASVVVIAKSGALQTYTVKFVRALSSDATLQALTYNGLSVPNFKTTRLVYEVSLPSSTTAIPTISAVATDPNARIVLIQANTFPGQASVVVVAADGSTSLTYTVEFKKGLNNDATLKSIAYDGTAISPFDKEELSYMVSLPTGTTSVPYVTAEAQDAAARVDISQPLSLPGEAQIVVTAEDGTLRTYIVYFTVLSTPTDISERSADHEADLPRKVLRDGHLWILHGGKAYSVLGY